MTVYEVITERILTQLEKGVVPWRRPWAESESLNVVSKKAYCGANAIMLPGGWFGTYKQIKDIGGSVKKGVHGFPVVFFSFPEGKGTDPSTEEDEGKKDKRTAPILRYYHVFRLEDCEGIDRKKFTNEEGGGTSPSSIEAAESIVMSMPNRPSIVEKASPAAYYCPSTDSVRIPERSQFSTIEEFYSTLFHELAHSTGHQDRLDRKTLTELAAFGSETYGKEELVAEFGASFLCGSAKIDNTTIKNSAAYIASWKKAIKADSKMVIKAAGMAQKAADYILG